MLRQAIAFRISWRLTVRLYLLSGSKAVRPYGKGKWYSSVSEILSRRVFTSAFQPFAFGNIFIGAVQLSYAANSKALIPALSAVIIGNSFQTVNRFHYLFWLERRKVAARALSPEKSKGSQSIVLADDCEPFVIHRFGQKTMAFML